ncbi:DUF4440 domain-containing protein [Phyllobacterium phragmitis]|uniref:DUF4440 domain-containing protein n=1 Tax=Phyllobacterium phragmitis TaxID=2670329 RepID=A0A2S9IT06_9HYPH|nr:nuclear transport factor 2 family protein [Phyllobacterium phragmitis]PRD43656.1 DUF4440 domain-containing protein [Phyllobacterium phragmitis]
MITSIYRTWWRLLSDDVGNPGTNAEQADDLTRSEFLRLMTMGLVSASAGLSVDRAFAQMPSDTTPVTDLDKVYDAWQDRFNAGDLDGLLALYAADVTYINPDGAQLIGQEATRADYAGLLALKPKIEIGDRKHAVYQNIALTTNHWTLELADSTGAMQKLTGGGIEVVRNQDGAGWLFIIDDASRSAS